MTLAALILLILAGALHTRAGRRWLALGLIRLVPRLLDLAGALLDTGRARR